MKVSLSECKLSDSSVTHSVCITDDDDQTAEIHCLDKSKAARLWLMIGNAIEEATGLSEIRQ